MEWIAVGLAAAALAWFGLRRWLARGFMDAGGVPADLRADENDSDRGA